MAARRGPLSPHHPAPGSELGGEGSIRQGAGGGAPAAQERFIEAALFIIFFQRLRADMLAQSQRGRAAAHQVKEDESEQNHPAHRRHHLPAAFANIADHEPHSFRARRRAAPSTS